MTVELAVAVLIAIGLVGIVVPVLPGVLLVWVGVLVWALDERTTSAEVVLVLATVLVAASQYLKYRIPGRRMKTAGVPTATLVAGGVLGVAGFFVIPVAGLVVGFVLGVYLAEVVRLRSAGPAVRSSAQALVAVVHSTAIELAAGVLVALAWAVVATTT